MQLEASPSLYQAIKIPAHCWASINTGKRFSQTGKHILYFDSHLDLELYQLFLSGFFCSCFTMTMTQVFKTMHVTKEVSIFLTEHQQRFLASEHFITFKYMQSHHILYSTFQIYLHNTKHFIACSYQFLCISDICPLSVKNKSFTSTTKRHSAVFTWCSRIIFT